MIAIWSALLTAALVTAGCVVAAPVLYKGFSRRGKGVFYERKFLIQRAPQYMTLVNVILIVLAFITGTGLVNLGIPTQILSSASLLGYPLSDLIAGLGILILISGLIFMIGGWYSLGEYFTTDAEVLDGHKVRKDGLLKLVMHPAYSGIIQCLLGASLAADSLFAAAVTVFCVAPLWLNRAIYEESLLLESLGAEYKTYAEEMGWRRLVPKFIPIGV